MKDTEFFERIARIERVINDVETTLRRLALHVQREDAIHRAALAEAKRCLTEIKDALDTPPVSVTQRPLPAVNVTEGLCFNEVSP